MPQKEFLFTAEGLAKLESELKHLESVRRQEVAAKIQLAKEMGGMENNAEYEKHPQHMPVSGCEFFEKGQQKQDEYKQNGPLHKGRKQNGQHL